MHCLVTFDRTSFVCRGCGRFPTSTVTLTISHKVLSGSNGNRAIYPRVSLTFYAHNGHLRRQLQPESGRYLLWAYVRLKMKPNAVKSAERLIYEKLTRQNGTVGRACISRNLLDVQLYDRGKADESAVPVPSV